MKYLALDIGNVCLDIDQPGAWRKMGFAGMDPAMLKIAMLFETGYIAEEDALRRLCALLPAGSKTPAEIREIFLSILVRPKEGMTELISSLPARGIQPVFFSDISLLHLEKTRKMFPAAAQVPCGIFSCEVGAMKPDLRMFRAFEARFGKPFLYVDDRADLIDAAVRHGWNAHRFVSAQELERTLFPA